MVKTYKLNKFQLSNFMNFFIYITYLFTSCDLDNYMVELFNKIMNNNEIIN